MADPKLPLNDFPRTDNGVSSIGRFDVIGESPVFLDFQERLAQAAPIERSVLLIGERGTGKEMAARRLHFLSKRWGQPFVTLNCAALSPSLIESELFGHEEGAFTGARKRRIGRFEAADGGTLFLDEISLIPIETQEKILRVVEYGAFERVGGQQSIQVDVRILGATNANLAREAQSGRFKSDLLDRLSFEVLFLPPLRERGEDILVLAQYFATRMAFELGRSDAPEFSDEAQEALQGYLWPGNVRELKNVVERAVYRNDDLIQEVEFDPFRCPYVPLPETLPPAPVVSFPEKPMVTERVKETEERPDTEDGTSLDLLEATRRLELDYLRRALEQTRFNQRLAADTLGLTYHQFRGLYRKYTRELAAL
jgi:psp operon transcriptional activator